MINPKYRDFIKENADVLLEMFNERLAKIMEAMILEDDDKKRERARELAIEFKCWLIEIGLIKKPRRVKKESDI